MFSPQVSTHINYFLLHCTSFLSIYFLLCNLLSIRKPLVLDKQILKIVFILFFLDSFVWGIINVTQIIFDPHIII